jgi:drug/metabolite transporter (DMT)-like permease
MSKGKQKFLNLEKLISILWPCIACLVLSAASDRATQSLVPGLGLPVLVTMAQLLVSASGGLLFLLAKSHVCVSSRSESDFENMRSFLSSFRGISAILPLGICQAVGFLATNLSLALDDMSFHHCIKASEPLFTAILSFLILGQRSPALAYATLVPIMLGIVLSAAAGVHYSGSGLAYALASNACFSLRSVLATALLRPDSADDRCCSPRANPPPRRRLTSFSLYVLMSAVAAAILVAVHAATEFHGGGGGLGKAPPPAAAAGGLLGRVDGRERRRTGAQLAAAGTLHLLYNAASFQARRAACVTVSCAHECAQAHTNPSRRAVPRA